MTPKYLHVGGLVAAGFDSSGTFLLMVSHSDRGLYAIGTWERVARDYILAYPDQGKALGIGPLQDQTIAIVVTHDELLRLSSPDGAYCLDYQEGTIAITTRSTSP
jgi:hypothetical protein